MKKNAKKNVYFIALLYSVCVLNSCSNNGKEGVENKVGYGDTLRENIDEIHFRNMDEQLFSMVKNNDYHKVYILRESIDNEYGYLIWRDYWIIDDLSKEEYNEMKKYSEFIYYFDKVLKNEIVNHGVYDIKNINYK